MPTIELRQDTRTLARLWPGGRPPALFPIDPARYYALFPGNPAERVNASLKQIRKRLPANAFGDVLCSLDWLLRYSARLFPGFASVCGEFVNEDWLALVDYHKNFHRDHIVHQGQTAVVVQTLLDGLKLDCDRHLLAQAYRDAWWTPLPERGCYVTLRELAAYCLALGEDGSSYLMDYARELGVQPQWLEPRTPGCFWFWREVVYNAAVTAALYHDIGYPVQFLRGITRKVNRSRFTDLIQGGEVERVYELFDDPLCLMPFRGYRSNRRIGRSHAATPDINQAIGRALRESHGLPGGLTFLYLNHEVMDVRSERRNATGRLTIELAALAIVMHDMQRIYLGEEVKREWTGQPLTPRRPHMRVAFRRDPVSFVLGVADQIQSYGRFHANFRSEDDKVMLTLDQQVEGCRLEYEPSGEQLDIVYRYDKAHSGACLRQKVEWGPDEEADAFDPRLGFLDYAGLFDRIALGVERI
ncbi:MAG: hypothetical protein P9F19_15290 [Candidatus Contendobacter sp.]|nr:hypothetical protein [Candidatus Contendobacter sp.]MDG4558738.1 hypothetical protein [Candidatus Contendobacter sp.]